MSQLLFHARQVGTTNMIGVMVDQEGARITPPSGTTLPDGFYELFVPFGALLPSFGFQVAAGNLGRAMHHPDFQLAAIAARAAKSRRATVVVIPEATFTNVQLYCNMLLEPEFLREVLTGNPCSQCGQSHTVNMLGFSTQAAQQQVKALLDTQREQGSLAAFREALDDDDNKLKHLGFAGRAELQAIISRLERLLAWKVDVTSGPVIAEA